MYQGAPAPVTAYIATVSKGAMFAVLLRFFYGSGAHNLAPVFLVFTIIAIASMIAGNILALLQSNVKRILAYSSIAHLGYLLVAFQAAGDLGPTAVTFYLVAYFVTTLGAFGVVSSPVGRRPGCRRLSKITGACSGGAPPWRPFSRRCCFPWPEFRSPQASSASFTS